MILHELYFAGLGAANRPSAALAAASLLEMGYLDVKSIAGGFDAWVAAGKTVVKPSVPSFE